MNDASEFAQIIDRASDLRARTREVDVNGVGIVIVNLVDPRYSAAFGFLNMIQIDDDQRVQAKLAHMGEALNARNISTSDLRSVLKALVHPKQALLSKFRKLLKIRELAIEVLPALDACMDMRVDALDSDQKASIRECKLLHRDLLQELGIEAGRLKEIRPVPSTQTVWQRRVPGESHLPRSLWLRIVAAVPDFSIIACISASRFMHNIKSTESWAAVSYYRGQLKPLQAFTLVARDWQVTQMCAELRALSEMMKLVTSEVTSARADVGARRRRKNKGDGKRLCFNFEGGFCRFGSNCVFSHSGCGAADGRRFRVSNWARHHYSSIA
eukprot:TRINITY_DN38555_c0_g1_i1.p1 TRINITY_DN38555_c0_g1~~TRINITY_DN38555_c0_g1_i1.p1  ORF type:complete len:327 (+),score=30.74 TRINITY_DN38555_c0_g1_i1:74-1054(+)